MPFLAISLLDLSSSLASVQLSVSKEVRKPNFKREILPVGLFPQVKSQHRANEYAPKNPTIMGKKR